MNSTRTRFYRDKINGKFFGVCAGIADFTGIDVLWVRIGMVVSLFTPFSAFTLPGYFVAGFLADKKPGHLYVDRSEQQFWQRVRQSPARSARDVRASLRDVDRRLAEVEAHYVTNNPRLADEIERLR